MDSKRYRRINLAFLITIGGLLAVSLLSMIAAFVVQFVELLN